MIEDPPCGTEWHLTGWAKALAADTNTNTNTNMSSSYYVHPCTVLEKLKQNNIAKNSKLYRIQVGAA